ncbi:hypothetical protein KTJ53_00835 [Acinetobacter variabilis]|uniref:hypothetical protein n=1 Tax=Acinetobacter variabilis TaxID=70346 RepID=UPI0004ADF7CC|nr:hypothetical protein [Acinetobacter variabilis]MCU4628262.1 hypothetical protein [Acinetobacter variabilis]
MRNLFIAGVITISLIGCAKNNEADILAKETQSAAEDLEKARSQISQPESISSWEYDESIDEMRGTKAQYAYLKSDNRIDFDFPYDGGSFLQITLRKNNNNPSDVMFAISKGQFHCNTITESCFAAIKFDNGSIQNIELAGSADHSSEIMFISHQSDVNKFIAELKSSKNLIIELPFYREGNKQFKFKLSELNWDTPKQVNKKSQPATSMAETAAIDAVAAAEAAAADATAVALDAEALLEAEAEE